ncbi:MAG: ABC transporter ATP-binding protein [Bacteroidota bacterium]|nr:ABC transporter ATP-binding protein [Bacteroidota bacterium]MDP4230192.1 ABC transporter ATP-binding protein [Bacteroidota bacterium]MDP4237161.1 ABC transporter ATP-binding protein [Bacteroidota bacterium]
MPHLELKNIEKKYSSGSDAVKGISFSAEQGEFIVLVGPSGCGKSTTLRMIAGLEEATGGDILIDGKRVNDLPPKDRNIAMVFQNYALYPHLSVFENIAFPLSIRKERKEVVDQEVRKAAALLSITHLLDRKPKELSGGERQRVAVGRAIIRKPAVFLFDEPLSNLDAALRTEMRAELKNLQRRLGTTMVYVTHDQTEAMTMGDKIVVLSNGLIEQFGSPHEIYSKPKSTFVARFLGSPAMNLIRGELSQSNGRAIFFAPSFELELGSVAADAGKQVLLGIRPEAFSVTGSANPTGKSEIRGLLSLTERLGSATNYYMESSLSLDGRMTASAQSVMGSEEYEIGSEIIFRISHGDVHLFDPENGLRIA